MAFFIPFNACTTSDLEPSTEQNKPVEGGITSVTNLYGVLKGAYNFMTFSGYYGRDYIITNEVRTDNCWSNGNSGRFTTQASLAYNENTGFFWDEGYNVIASANAIISQDINSLEGDTDFGTHIQGQAYALRALAHFDLLKQYGQMNAGGSLGIPYITEFVGANAYPARNTVSEVKTMIMSDLETAFNLMSDDYYDSSKRFMSKYTAKALESRVAIYFGDWETAKSAAEAVIASGHYSIVSKDNYVASWQSNGSSNSLFELAFSATDNLSSNSIAYIYRTTKQGAPSGGSYGDIQVIDEVADIFEAGDVRGVGGILGWEDPEINEVVPYDPNKVLLLRNIGKYPDNKGYNDIPVIRYEEVILNYAEALMHTGGDALTQLNLIPANRGASLYATATEENILNERRKELMFEGLRFDDLMRTGSDIVKYSLQQNISATVPYGDHRLAFPIPATELNANSNMVQNDGY